MATVLDVIVRTAERQAWLDPLADRAQRSVVGAYAAGGGVGQRLKNAMHGLWLGHSLHTALTDVPIGAWTTAAVLDALEAAGNDDLGPGADAAVGLGLVSSLPTALTGLTDWSSMGTRARRQGMVHGLLNAGVTLMYLASFFMRRNGRRAPARSLALAAYGVATVSAYIGGHLVGAERIGVDYAQGQELEEKWRRVLPEAELPHNQPAAVDVEGVSVMLVRQGNVVRALAATCAHLGGPLNEGTVEGDSIICPWHGSRFSLKDGRVLDGPSVYDQPCFVARITNGQVEVRGNRLYDQ